MKTTISKAVPVSLAIIFLLLTLISSASADQLHWKTEKVYFRGDVLYLEGKFLNDTPNIVDHVNEFRARVRRLHDDDWQQVTSATFRDLDIRIRPGAIKPFIFRIHEVEPRPIKKWKVNTWMEYHYLNHHRDERQRHERDWD